MECDRRRRLEFFAIKGGENADDIVGACRRLYDAGAGRQVSTDSKGSVVRLLLVNCFHELANDQRNTLYSLDLFLCPNKLSFQRSDGCQS